MSEEETRPSAATPAPVEEVSPAITELEAQVAQEKRSRRRAAPWALIAIVGTLAVGGLGVLQLDTRAVATTSTRCARGDDDSCRGSAARIARACRPPSIKASEDPARARRQCRELARALEPLQLKP